MNVSARIASPDDLPRLLELYRLLEAEMVALKPLWDIAEGLPEPVDAAMARLVDDDRATVLVGEFDGVPFGFLAGLLEELLPQAGAAQRATVKYIFTEEAARQVGIAEAMMGAFLEWADAHGVDHVDAHVSPGHRLAKNFFESNGFKARHIVMYAGRK
ncbi:MAG TPA: GNAT family N-acetyltransferase [Acidimicrobiia bacterium]|nr:GNAT family N-acetyltransferase [Acidimicrobiia bacterium]